MPTRLKQLFDDIDPDTNVLNKENLKIDRIDELLNACFGFDEIEFEMLDPAAENHFEVTYQEVPSEYVLVKGKAYLFGKVPIPVNVTFTEVDHQLDFVLKSTDPGVEQRMKEVEGHLLGRAVCLPEQLGEFSFNSFAFSFKPSTATVGIDFKSNRTLTVIRDCVAIEEPAVSILAEHLLNEASRYKIAMGGTIILGDLSIKITKGVIDDGFMLEGIVPVIELSKFVDELPGPAFLQPPGFPDITLEDSHFEIRLKDDDFSMTLVTDEVSFGKISVIAAKVEGSWQYCGACVLPSGWNFDDIMGLDFLKPLDLLKIRSPKLIFSSFDRDDYRFPEICEIPDSVCLTAGIAIRATLDLTEGVLKLVGMIIGKSGLDFSIFFDKTELTNVKVTAYWDQSFQAFPGSDVMVLSDFQLPMKVTTPLSFNAQSTVTFNMGEALPDFILKVGFNMHDPSLQFTMKTAGDPPQPWVDPLQIRGLTVTKLVLMISLSVGDSAIRLGIDGAILLRDGKEVSVALVIDLPPPPPPRPRMLMGQIKGELSVQDLAYNLVGITVPDVISPIRVRDPFIYIVPFDTILDDEVYKQGLGLRGTLVVFGLEMSVWIEVSRERVFAEGKLNKKIEVGSLLLISDDEFSEPPKLRLDTSAPPFVLVSVGVILLGLHGSRANATLDANGFTMEISEHLGGANYNLKCGGKPGHVFTAAGTMGFEFDQLFKNIEILPGADKCDVLLNFKVYATIDGKVSLEDMADPKFELNLGANVTIESALGEFSFAIATFQMEIRSGTVDQIRAEFQKRAIDIISQDLLHKGKLFQDLFSQGERLLKAIRKGILKLAQKHVKLLARILERQYKMARHLIALSIRDTLQWGSKVAAVGLTELTHDFKEIGTLLRKIRDDANRIALALKDLRNAGQIANILKDIGDPADTIAVALRRIDVGIQDIGPLLKDIGVGYDPISKALHAISAPPKDIAEFLKNGMKCSVDQIGGALNGIGVQLDEIANLLGGPGGLGYSFDDVAQGLRAAGAEISDTGEILKDGLSAGRSAVQRALGAAGAGFSGGNVEKAVKKIFG